LPPPSKLHANRVGVAGGHPHDHVPEHEISKNVCDSRVDAGHAGVPPGGGKFVRHGIDGGLGQRLPVEPGAKVRVLEDHGERQGRLNCGDDDLVAGVRHPRCPSELGGGLRRRVDQCVDVYRGRSSDLSLAHGDGCTCGSSWQLTRSWLKGGAARAGSPDGGSRGIGRPRGREVGSHPHRLRSAGPPLRGGWGKPGLGLAGPERGFCGRTDVCSCRCHARLSGQLPVDARAARDQLGASPVRRMHLGPEPRSRVGLRREAQRPGDEA
jgi:hypothetical protein